MNNTKENMNNYLRKLFFGPIDLFVSFDWNNSVLDFALDIVVNSIVESLGITDDDAALFNVWAAYERNNILSRYWSIFVWKKWNIRSYLIINRFFYRPLARVFGGAYVK